MIFYNQTVLYRIEYDNDKYKKNNRIQVDRKNLKYLYQILPTHVPLPKISAFVYFFQKYTNCKKSYN